MDKETLSNYGWIVICVLVLAVMLALASPFGKFISTAVQSTTQGLFDVNQSALGAAGIVIDDQSFADTNGGTEGEESTPIRTESKDHGAVEWDDLISASEDGSYKTEYLVGDLVTLTLKDGSKAQFRIVGIDHDDLTSGGKAHLTLVNENTLFNHNMNATYTNAGGWSASDMRTYLNGDFKDTYIPDEVLSSIKAVDKQTYTCDGTNTQTTSDQLWIPSYTEVGFTDNTTINSAEGGFAYAYFTSDDTRIKNSSWWLRSVYSSNSHSFYYVNSGGANHTNDANDTYGVVLGFCI